MLSNCDAQDVNKIPFHTHPHDPSVDDEYDTLVRAWKHELIDNTPTTPNSDYVRFAWMRLMDHYLDQHWLDSKQMLQCAQAWSSRNEISIKEAVHTMNTLSLKSMQRSLDARQELLHALSDPELMGFGISHNNEKKFSTCSSVSLAGSEQDVHAPLLVKHNNSPKEEDSTNLLYNDDEAIITCMSDTDSKDVEAELPVEGEIVEEEIKSRHVYEEDEEDEDDEDDDEDISPLSSHIYTRSISSSVSSPNLSSSFHHNGIANSRKYESYYQKSNERSTPWKEIHTKNNQDEEEVGLLLEEDSNSSLNSDISSPLGSGIQWKSWFVGNEQHQHQELTNIEFANEKVETDDTFLTEEYVKKQPMPAPQKQSPFLMVRSESSISAFRPISNNLAPRCQIINSSSTSDLPSITKSKSFPTKAALSSEVHTPPPIPHQRNFMIRSIVSKKVSLSKLFGSKKSSSSSSSS